MTYFIKIKTFISPVLTRLWRLAPQGNLPCSDELFNCPFSHEKFSCSVVAIYNHFALRNPDRPLIMNDLPKKNHFYFVLLLLVLYFLYVKVGVIFPPLGKLHLPFIVLVLLSIFLLNNILKGQIKFDEKLTLLIIAFFVAMILSTFTAYVVFRSYRTLVDNFEFLALYLFILLLINCKPRYFWFVCMLLMCALTASLQGISYYLDGKLMDNLAISGPLSGADDCSAFFAMITPFCFFQCFQVKGFWKYAMFIVLCLIMGSIILLGSRGGFLGLAAVVILMAYYTPNKKIFCTFSIIGAILLFMLAPPQFFSEVKSITDTEEGTASHRLGMWQDGIEIFLENPGTGIGLNNFATYHGHHFMGKMGSSVRLGKWKVAHSDPVTILCEFGIIGFLVYVSICYYIVKTNLYMINKYKYGEKNSFYAAMSRANFISFCGYIVCSIFITTIYYPNLYIIAALTVCLKRISEENTATDIIGSS